MNFIQVIKRPRHLTFNHWRYRILHWTFNIEPSTPEESSLPNFLYTHYCPLFHMTNMLLLVSPITLILKIALSLLKFPLKFVKFVFQYFDGYVSHKLEKKKEEKERSLHVKEAFDKAMTYAVRRAKRLNIDIADQKQFDDALNDFFINLRAELGEIPNIDKVVEWANSSFRAVFENKYQQHLRSLEDISVEKKNNTAKMALFVRIAEGVIKSIVWVILGLLAAGFLWTVAQVIYLMFFIEWIYVLSAVLQGLVVILILPIPIILVITYLVMHPSTEKFVNIGNDALQSFTGFMLRIFESMGEFIDELYSENCPPVIIEQEVKIEEPPK